MILRHVPKQPDKVALNDLQEVACKERDLVFAIQSLEETISLSQQRCEDIQEENKRAAVALETTQNKMLDAQRELGGNVQWISQLQQFKNFLLPNTS